MKNTRLKLALAIPTGAPMKVANDAIEMLPLVADKTNKDLSKQSKEPIYLLSLLLINSVSLISATKQCLTSLILFSLNCYWSFKFGYILGIGTGICMHRNYIGNCIIGIALNHFFFFFELCSEKRLVKLSIQSINPIQKYPHITELYTCILKHLFLCFYFQ